MPAARGQGAELAGRLRFRHRQGRRKDAGLHVVRDRDAEAVFHHSREWHRVFTGIRRGSVPAIAALHGATAGGGLGLASACHLRVADATAFFALPEDQRGVYVGGGASVLTARLIGASRMAGMMLTGRVLNATEAERAGLVNYLEPAGSAGDRAAVLAEKVAGMAPLTVPGVLQALPRIQSMSEDDGLFVESMMAAMAQTGAAAATRLTDFVEKRGAKVEEPPE